jgi:hypothetical protein
MGKNQHYIPRFLLKHFSEEKHKKSLTLYYIKDKRIISNASIDGQASNDYIYGSDQIIETLLHRIETDSANAIIKLINNERLNEDENNIIKLFIHLQMNRTPFNANVNNEIADLVFKNIYGSDTIYGNTKIKLKNPCHLSIFSGFATKSLLSDLSIALLENNTEIPFLLGQRPAYLINPYLYEKKIKFWSQGIAVKGVCILLPISFQKTLIVYDKYTYKIIKNNGKIELNKNDIFNLNKYQFYYTTNCVFIKKNTDINYLNNLNEVTNNFRNKTILEIKPVKYHNKSGIYEEIKMPGDNMDISVLNIKNQAYCESLLPTKGCLVRPTIIQEVIKIETTK